MHQKSAPSVESGQRTKGVLACRCLSCLRFIASPLLLSLRSSSPPCSLPSCPLPRLTAAKRTEGRPQTATQFDPLFSEPPAGPRSSEQPVNPDSSSGFGSRVVRDALSSALCMLAPPASFFVACMRARSCPSPWLPAPLPYLRFPGSHLRAGKRPLFYSDRVSPHCYLAHAARA